MDPDNVFRFLLALVLTPILFRIGRHIRFPRAGRIAFVIGVAAMVVGFGVSSVDSFVPWVGWRLARHLMFTVGGFGLAWAAWKARQHELAANGAQR